MNMRVFCDVITVVFIFVVNSALESRGQNFTIIRSRNPNLNSKDYFNAKLPSSIRQTAPCSTFGASKTSSKPHRCVCDLTNRPTFGLFNGKWQCFDDIAIRSSEGCKAQLYDRYSLSTFSSAILILPNLPLFEEFKSKRLLGCSLMSSYTQYHSCNGSWSAPADAVYKFHILEKGFSGIFDLQEIHQLGKEFEGRLIKLSIKCQTWSGVQEDCLIFKIAGNTSCKASPSTGIQPPLQPVSTPVHHATKSSSFSPVLPVTKSVPLARNGSIIKQPGNNGGSKLKSKGNSVGAIVGAVVAVLVAVIGAVVTVLILKRKGKFGQRTSNFLKERSENPSNQLTHSLSENPSNQRTYTLPDIRSTQLIRTLPDNPSNQLIRTLPDNPSNQLIHTLLENPSNQLTHTLSDNPSNVCAEVSRDVTQSEEGPQSPLYAVVGKKSSKKIYNSADGTEYPEYARVVKSQVSQQSNQSVGYDYACSEAPSGKKNNLPLPSFLERCPEHGSTVSIASLRSISRNCEDVHDGDDDDDDDDDDSGGYEHLVENKDTSACETSGYESIAKKLQNSVSDEGIERRQGKGQESVEHDQKKDGNSTSYDNDGYEIPVGCSVKEKQRALLELLASQTSNKENELINNLLSSTKGTSTSDVDEIPEQGVYSVLENEALNQEHVYQALIDTCDVYAPLQNTEATPPSLPSQPDSLEHEFGETPI